MWLKAVSTHQANKGPALHVPGFDLAVLVSAIDDEQAVINLLSLFQQETLAMMEKVESDIEDKDIAGAEWHLHRMKGAVGNVGAMQLHAACEILDAELKQGAYTQASLAALRTAFRAAMEALDELLHRSVETANPSPSREVFELAITEIDGLLAGQYLIPDELLSQLVANAPPSRLDLCRLVKQHIKNIDYNKARVALKKLPEDLIP